MAVQTMAQVAKMLHSMELELEKMGDELAAYLEKEHGGDDSIVEDPRVDRLLKMSNVTGWIMALGWFLYGSEFIKELDLGIKKYENDQS